MKCNTGVRFTNTKTLLSYLLTGTLLMKNSTSRENCDSRAWWILALKKKYLTRYQHKKSLANQAPLSLYKYRTVFGTMLVNQSTLDLSLLDSASLHVTVLLRERFFNLGFTKKCTQKDYWLNLIYLDEKLILNNNIKWMHKEIDII